MSSLNYMELCRLCLVKDRVQIPIFEGEGDIRQIFLKIAACLPVKVKKDDKLPKKICDECMYKVESLYQFWNTTANAEKQLLEWLGEAVEDKKTSSDAHVKQEGLEQDPCSELAKSLSRVEAVLAEAREAESDNDHFATGKAETDSDDEPLSSLEPTTFVNVGLDGSGTSESRTQGEFLAPGAPSTSKTSNSTNAQTTTSGHCKDVRAESVIKHVDNPECTGEYKCLICGKSYGKELALYVHITSHSQDIQNLQQNFLEKVSKIMKNRIIDSLSTVNKENRIPEDSSKNCFKYECNNCSKINFVYGQLSESNLCDFCGHSLVKGQNETEDADEREEEEEEKAFPDFYECDTCKESFTSKKELLCHLKTHMKERTRARQRKSAAKSEEEEKTRRKKRSKSEKPFKCDEENCQYATSQYSLLKSHKFKHNPFFKCVTCQEKFSSRLELKNHMSSHGERPFKCDQCNKCYKDKHGLGWHKKVQHEPSRLKFTCELCGKTYPFDSLLTQHINLTHAAEKQTVCDICGKNVSKTYLPMHRRTHGEKQYSCDICEKTFLEKAYLKRHKMVHTGEKPYVCSVCGNSFRQHSTLTIHMRTHTGDRPYKCVLCENAYKTHHNLKKHYKRSGHKVV